MQKQTGSAHRRDASGWPDGSPGAWPEDGAAAAQGQDRDDGQSWPDGTTPWPRRPRRHHGFFERGPRGSGPLRRGQDDALAGGVAAGLAARLGRDVTLVRLAFVVATVLTIGYAAVAYVVAWLLVPAAGTDRSIASKARSDGQGIAFAAGLGSLLIVALVTASALGAGWLGTPGSAFVICAVGMVLIWRNAGASEQASLRHLTGPMAGLTAGRKRSRTVLRAVIAAVLLIAGLSTLASTHEGIKFLRPLGGLALVIAAIAVILGPWWLGIARDLVAERQARIRAEERADIAARVHDSVLQTLALIQRRADQPQQVIQLARAQERELRAWLFDGRPPGSLVQDTTLADGVRQIQQDVEARHEITVEAVTVGDCELDDDLAALLAAAREATVNAAKWSGAEVVSLFAEVEPGAVSLYVRDRGRGFDPAAVPGDRKGLAESIHARMARRGGSSTIRSAPGEGTEVSLTLPRAAGKRQPGRA